MGLVIGKVAARDVAEGRADSILQALVGAIGFEPTTPLRPRQVRHLMPSVSGLFSNTLQFQLFPTVASQKCHNEFDVLSCSSSCWMDMSMTTLPTFRCRLNCGSLDAAIASAFSANSAASESLPTRFANRADASQYRNQSDLKIIVVRFAVCTRRSAASGYLDDCSVRMISSASESSQRPDVPLRVLEYESTTHLYSRSASSKRPIRSYSEPIFSWAKLTSDQACGYSSTIRRNKRSAASSASRFCRSATVTALMRRYCARLCERARLRRNSNSSMSVVEYPVDLNQSSVTFGTPTLYPLGHAMEEVWEPHCTPKFQQAMVKVQICSWQNCVSTSLVVVVGKFPASTLTTESSGARERRVELDRLNRKPQQTSR